MPRPANKVWEATKHNYQPENLDHDGVPQLEVLKHVITLRQSNLHSGASHGQRRHPRIIPALIKALTGTSVQALPSVRQFPSAFDTVCGSAFTVQSCFGSSEHSSTYTVCVDVPGSTPFAVMHQSPYAICPGTPVPEVANSAVRSFEEPSPASCATRSALAAADWGPKTRVESTRGSSQHACSSEG